MKEQKYNSYVSELLERVGNREDDEEENILARWKKLGMLEGIQNRRVMRSTALAMEEAARDLIVNATVDGAYQTVIFPMIRRIITDARIVHLDIYVTYSMIINILNENSMRQFIGFWQNTDCTNLMDCLYDFCNENECLDTPILKIDIAEAVQSLHESLGPTIQMDIEAELVRRICDYIVYVIIERNNQRKF